MIKRLLLFAALILGVNAAPLWAAQPPHLVFMIGEDEYHTWETLPEFAEKQLKVRGYRVTIVHADAADKNNFPGLVAALAYGLFVPLAEQSPLVRTVSLVSIFLNGFNLLPFWPLDGGHLVERTLLPGHPRLGVAFIALSASVLVGLAWVHGDWVAVVAVSVAAIFSLRSGLAVASVLRALPTDGPSGQLPADCCTLVDLYRLAALVHGGDDDDRKRFSLVRRLEPRVFARAGSSRYRAAFFLVYVLVLLSAAWSIDRVLNP